MTSHHNSEPSTIVGKPTILDTDIGMDVDDVWALAFLLRCPELDLRMVLSSTGDTHYGASLVGKLLEVEQRTDVHLGVGLSLDEQPRTHTQWLGDYSVADYPGQVSEDGVGALIETIMSSPEPVTLISIGPLANIAAALAREPRIVNNSCFVGMHGSIRRGYMGRPKPAKEYNVKKHTVAAQRVFSTPWQFTLTPLDTCGDVQLQGERFARIQRSDDPLARAVMANHNGWFAAIDWPIVEAVDPLRESSILFDTVAVYLGYSQAHLAMENLPIVVTDDAKTCEDSAGQMMQCAMDWRDRAGFLDMLTERLTQNETRQG